MKTYQDLKIYNLTKAYVLDDSLVIAYFLFISTTI